MRCSRLPPTVAMLRICAEAPARMARRAAESARARAGRPATAVFLHAGADAQAAAFRLLDVAGEPGHVHQQSGCSMVSRIRSTRLVPPPRYLAPARARAPEPRSTSDARS